MIIDISIWNLLSIITKVIIYISLAMSVSLPTIWHLSGYNKRLLSTFKNHTYTLALLGISMIVVYFFIQVGTFSENGFFGMFDLTMFNLIWNSGNGDVMLFRILALMMTVILCLLCLKDSLKDSTLFYRIICLLMYVVSIFFVIRTFSFTGHTMGKGSVISWMLSVHVGMALWWIGALWPLYRACSLVENNHLYRLMKSFGKIALFLVTLLIVSGIFIIYVLLFYQKNVSVYDTLTSNYGLFLLVKLFFVGGLLGMAALHKLVYVPSIVTKNSAHTKNVIGRLSRSISLEMFLGYCVLALTAVLTTLIGPE